MWHLTFRFTHTQAAAMRATTPTITTATTTTTKTIAATALLGAIKTAKPNRVRSVLRTWLVCPFVYGISNVLKRFNIKERTLKYRCVVALILTNLINKLRNAYAAFMHSCVCVCALSLVKSACCSFLRLSTWSLRLAWSCLVGSFNYFTWIAEKMFITSSESLNKTLSIMGPMKMASEDARSFFFFLLLLFFFFSSAIVGYMNFDFNFGIDFCHWVAFLLTSTYHSARSSWC